MAQLLILLVVALVVGGLIFGVAVLVTGRDRGLEPVEPDSRAVPLPTDRPLDEADLSATRFDTALRGYRMDQVDRALRRAGYDIGYKAELIAVLEAEVAALREGRLDDAEALRAARERAAGSGAEPGPTVTAEPEPEAEPGREAEPAEAAPETAAQVGAEPVADAVEGTRSDDATSVDAGTGGETAVTDEPAEPAAVAMPEEDEWRAPSSTRR
ncbi:MAG TPA: DivIVA domain-containing protein [Micromonosporaceae bacterium]